MTFICMHHSMHFMVCTWISKLLEWLNTVTFPEEARYADLNYAEKAYSIFTDDLKTQCDHTSFHLRHLTCRCNRTSDGPDGENRTQKLSSAKINMDRNGSKALQEESAVVSATRYCPLA